MTDGREAEFRELFADAYADALRFAQRRAPERHAEEAVASAMLVAWRRFDDAPRTHGARRAWLFGIVRRTLLNAARGQARQDALAVRLADAERVSGDDPTVVDLRIDLARAWRTLDATHQEVLALAILDDLPAARAASVLGISAVAYRARLMRARKALRAAMQPAVQDAACPLEPEEAR